MKTIGLDTIRLRSRRSFHFGVPLVAVSLAIAASALAFPRLAIEHAEACRDCHINPNGGGARTEYGNYSVAFNELCLPQTKKLVASHYRKPRLGESALIGFDTRHLVLRNNFTVVRMQTDAFVTVQPLKNLFYHMRFGGTAGISEYYGLLYLADQRYYVKAGRFYPAFGLHNEDHTAYNRSMTGNVPNLYLDGLSIGAEAFGVNVAAELLKQYNQGVYGLHAYRLGSLGSLGYMIGGSARYSEEFTGSYNFFPHAKALFGGLSYQRFTFMGEYDAIGRDSRARVAYVNLTTRLEYGCYLVGEGSYYDPDRRTPDDISQFVRLSLELYPLPFVQIRPSYTFYSERATKGLYGSDKFFLQLHLGY